MPTLVKRLLRNPWQLPELIWKNLKYPFTPLAAETRYDRRLGIDTAGDLGPFELGLTESRAAQSTGYGATPPSVFDHLMGKLDAPVNGFTFVDVGAGKGRVLLLASRRPFSKVIGLELSGELHAIAERNVATFVAGNPDSAPIEVLRVDATEYVWPATDCVLFLYNPLGPVLMRQVAENIRASYLANPRKLVIVYYYPKYPEAFDLDIFDRRDINDCPRDPTHRYRDQNFGAVIFETREPAAGASQ